MILMAKLNKNDLKNLEAQHDHARFETGGHNVLGIDYGTKYTGIAYADKAGGMIPIGVWDTDEDLLSKIFQCIDEKK